MAWVGGATLRATANPLSDSDTQNQGDPERAMSARHGSPERHFVRSVRKRAFRATLRARVLAIALVPSLVLLSVGVALSTYLLVSAEEQRDRADLLGQGYQMAVPFMPAMSQERRASIFMVADPTPENRTALLESRREMDGLLAQFGAISSEVANAMPAQAKAAVGAFVGKLPQIMATRQAIDAGQVSRLDVYRAYTEVADTMIVAAGAIGRDSTDKDVALLRTTAADLMRVADWLDGGNALAAGALAGGGMTGEELHEYNRLTQGYRAQLTALEPRLGEQQSELAQLRSSRAWNQLSTVESVLVEKGFAAVAASAQAQNPPAANPPAADAPAENAPAANPPAVDAPAENAPAENENEPAQSGPAVAVRSLEPPTLPVSPQEWQTAARDSATTLSSMGLGGLGIRAAALERDEADTAWVRSLAAALAMLIIVGIVAIIAIRLSNKLVRRLVRLRTETLKLADERLPQVLQRLRAGERIDVAAEVPELDLGRDEIGQVAAAFNKAQQTAVAAAVQEAKIREGINAVFLNIARRSQAIVHRQLQVLDTAERAADDPDQLELLFQLDHSTTRERRNAENLIILGGGQLGRQWRNPVSLVEIVRSAVAEAEQYTRVTIAPVPHVLVDGRAVADLIHLLAELIDNATSFSPPDSRIEVRGNPVGKGVVIEVEDQGLGIEAERRAAFNEMFRNPPDFGLMALSDDARIGFFVVAHLAHQHGIRVSLMESNYGGVRAGVLIPTALMTAPASDPDQAEQTAELAVQTSPPIADEVAVADNAVAETPPSAPGSTGTEQPVAPALPDPDERPAQPRRDVDDRPALPRRRRQAHLARPLQQEPVTGSEHKVPEPDFDRAARHARDTVSAFQQGTQRGRAGDADPGPWTMPDE